MFEVFGLIVLSFFLSLLSLQIKVSLILALSILILLPAIVL